MGKLYAAMTPEISAWIANQCLFFVSTAPLAAEGHVNCSPKGLDTFRVLSPNEVAYLDLTGSGAETIAHIQENGRILFMFCAFSGAPKIVRLHGHGTVHFPDSPGWNHVRSHFPEYPGVRSIIQARITRVSDSCGYGVPKFELVEPRDALPRWAENKGQEQLTSYRQEMNARSIDGLPGWESH